MSLNYIPMSTPDVASIRKEILVNIEDPIQNRSLLDPDVDGNEEAVNNDDRGERLMDPDAQDYTGADIYRARMMAETHYMDPSDLYYNNSHDVTNLSSGDNNPSLFGKEESNDQESLLDTDNDDFNYVPKEVYGAISYPSMDEGVIGGIIAIGGAIAGIAYAYKKNMKDSAKKIPVKYFSDALFDMEKLYNDLLNLQKKSKYYSSIYSHNKYQALASWNFSNRNSSSKRLSDSSKFNQTEIKAQFEKGKPVSIDMIVCYYDRQNEKTYNLGDDPDTDWEKITRREASDHLKALGFTKNYSNKYPNICAKIETEDDVNGVYININPSMGMGYYIKSDTSIKNESSLIYPSDHTEYYNESAMKAAERNALDDSEFGLPRLRKYPLNDKKHVKFAIRMFGHCKDPKDRAELAKRIFAKVKEFDMDVKIGKGNPLYEYAPKSLQESFAILSAEVPGIVSEEQFDKGTEKERQIRNLQIAARTANVLNFQPALGKAIANLKEYSFLEYFYPDVKSTAFSIRLLTCLGGLATNDMIWKLYGLRPPLCADNTQPLTHPNKPSPEEYEDKVIPWFRKQANWYNEGKAEDSIHIEYCLSLYSVLGVILLNPEFSMDNLDDYWMGVLTDWLNHVQTEYDELSASVNSTSEFYHRQYLYDLCWNPTENPMDEAIVTRNIINFASTMVSQKMKVDLNEAGGDLLNKDKCNSYIINQLDPEVVDNIYLLPDKMEYPILNQDSIRMAMDMIREVDETDRAKYARMLNKKYTEFGCTFSISIDHPYAEYADQNIIDHMTRVLSEGDTVVDDQGTSDAGPSPDQAPWYVRSDVNGNVGQNLLQNKELGPNDKKNTALNIDPTEPIIV